MLRDSGLCAGKPNEKAVMLTDTPSPLVLCAPNTALVYSPYLSHVKEYLGVLENPFESRLRCRLIIE